MFESSAFLKEIRIENYRSLRTVRLPLKPLTVLVGPNASGKSNVLSGIRLLSTMMKSEDPPPISYLQDMFWARQADLITIEAFAKIEESSAYYRLVLNEDSEHTVHSEHLKINDDYVISIQDGEGVVRDEDSHGEMAYKSKNLALKSAGDYGNKPVTVALSEFIRDWEFYDFQPGSMRSLNSRIDRLILEEFREPDEPPQLNRTGSILPGLLSFWHENEPTRFESVSNALADSTRIRIGLEKIDGDEQLCLLEGYANPIPLQGASDGTLRLTAYYTLLNEPVSHPLIAIEEPERNLHPRALRDIAEVLRRIAEQSQVIVTTHSFELLNAFLPESLSDSLCVLLLRNRTGEGTEIFSLEEILQNQPALEGWVADFGIGSGIFESELLKEMMENPSCQK